MEETHISSLKDKIEAIKLEIQSKQKHIDLLKDGISIDKGILRLYEKGLQKLTK